MQYINFLDRSENLQDSETIEKNRFLVYLFDALDISIEFDPSKEYSVQERVKLKTELKKHNLSIVLEGAELRVFRAQEEIAHWGPPKYVMKIDGKEVGRNKVYLEQTITYTTIFDHQENDS